MNARCRLDQPRPALKTRRGRSMLFLPPLGLIGRLTPKILTRTVNGLSMLDRRCLHTGQPSGWQTRDFPPIPLCQPRVVLDPAARYPRRKRRRGVPPRRGNEDVPRTGLGRRQPCIFDQKSAGARIARDGSAAAETGARHSAHRRRRQRLRLG